ncbi:Regulatory protein GntR [Thermobacillus xylanilyticus]|jgi:DNA-binding LacI/PurR family transcriptional regulator|uniref:Regulatory protein GntR n=1 Tax=Thermobacillus xylanilyticus TaxID=76633 RepID=A0ABN7RJ94_THEXY|nr:GntR family transcriptional regulator [Thermobacillus xylanilyticus]REJ21258.1 MAG: GntR family transcriptional regulator [Paenibacillaceae bacterium]CAG5076234.1 Regulatory protein GntR [Thermobacillus xylanilyticus]
MSNNSKPKKQLYLQIADKVLEIIESRGLKAHDPVPSEGELAKLFGVSRMTSKLALEQLVERGIVYRLPRRGTFLSGTRQEDRARTTEIPAQPPADKKENKMIALIVPHMTDYTSRIISAVEHEVRKHGYDLILRISKDEEDQGRCLQTLAEMGVSGIILFPLGSKSCSNQVFKLKMEKIPSVIIDRVFYEIPIDCVYHDHFQGSYDMAKYLISKGHREIGFSSNVIENITSRGERYQGYIQALLDHGIPVKSEYIHFRTSSIKPGHVHQYDAEQGEFIRNNPDMTAVMCADDQVAIATLFSALHMNISVPETLSIVGFSDTYLSALTPVPLTTVRQDTDKLAAAAVELLMKRVRQSKEQHITVKIQTQIIERKSVLDRSVSP